MVQTFYWICSTSFVTRKVCARQTKKSLDFPGANTVLPCAFYSLFPPAKIEFGLKSETIWVEFGRSSELERTVCTIWIRDTLHSEWWFGWTIKKRKYIFDVCTLKSRTHYKKTLQLQKDQEHCWTFDSIWRTRKTSRIFDYLR